MKEYCVDLEIAKELKKNGFPQKSFFKYQKSYVTIGGVKKKKYGLVFCSPLKVINFKSDIYAPTSDEILKELPANPFDARTLTIHKGTNEYNVHYQNNNRCQYFHDKKLSNALATMWLYLKKEGYLKYLGEFMNECYIDINGDVIISTWFRPGGGMMYRRDCMPHSTGESTLMCLIRLGKNPEDYGYKDPRKDCPHCKGTGIKQYEEELINERYRTVS